MNTEFGKVLILILMEDALRDSYDTIVEIRKPVVLILILMEDALRGHHQKHQSGHIAVLILILMEDALRVSNQV